MKTRWVEASCLLLQVMAWWVRTSRIDSRTWIADLLVSSQTRADQLLLNRSRMTNSYLIRKTFTRRYPFQMLTMKNAWDWWNSWTREKEIGKIWVLRRHLKIWGSRQGLKTWMKSWRLWPTSLCRSSKRKRSRLTSISQSLKSSSSSSSNRFQDQTSTLHLGRVSHSKVL